MLADQVGDVDVLDGLGGGVGSWGRHYWFVVDCWDWRGSDGYIVEMRVVIGMV